MIKRIDIDTARLVQEMCRFTAYVQSKDQTNGPISFRDSSSYLGRNEGYKTANVEKARHELNSKSWQRNWIGTGKIAKCAANAMSKADNLVNYNQKIRFCNRLNPQHADYRKDAEMALFEVFRSADEETAFAHAVDVFGAVYDTIAFLFFIKDDTRFLPISAGNFDKRFSLLNIDFKTKYKCSWDNYNQFVGIISDTRDIMDDIMPLKSKARLIDAHSFLWVMGYKDYMTWKPDAAEEARIEEIAEQTLEEKAEGPGGRKPVTSSQYKRSAEVIRITKARAKGVCQLCGNIAPFKDKKGDPYLEVHHVKWLSRGGKDSTDNTVALCSNCHARMHVLDSSEDLNSLIEICKQY